MNIRLDIMTAYGVSFRMNVGLPPNSIADTKDVKRSSPR